MISNRKIQACLYIDCKEYENTRFTQDYTCRKCGTNLTEVKFNIDLYEKQQY